MPVPIVYRKSQEPSIVSYNYTDISTGTGVVAFNGFQQQVSGAITFGLTQNSPYSAIDADTSQSVNLGTDTLTFDLTAFNLPQRVKGTAYLNFSVELETSGAGYVDITVNLQKVSNGSATTIGTNKMERMSRGGAGTTSKVHNIPLSLTTTHFSKGDNLRLTLAVICSGNAYIGVDPQNRAGTKLNSPSTVPTKMTLYVPFALDI